MKQPPLRLPTLILGLILVVIFSALTPYNNVKLQNSPLAGGHFPLASFGCLLLITALLNPILSRIRKNWQLSFHEILLVWCMVTAATGIAYTGFMRTFIINITTPEWFATATGSFAQVLHPLSPSSLFPKDPSAVKTLYSGLEGGLDMSWRELLSSIPWGVWAIPMLWWGSFMAMVYGAMIGVAGIFSHQWIENEKMNFPLLRVPEILCQESQNGTLLKFLTHRYFLMGFSIPVLLHLVNGLHTYYPEVPQIPTLILAQPFIPREGLLSGFYKMKIYIYPAFIGFAFLASKQVSFSLWSFFLLGGLLPGILQTFGWRLPAAALGITFGPVISKVEEMQMIGAFAVFFFFILWLARDHLRMVLRSVISGPALLDEFHGLLCPRISFFIFLSSFVGICAWLVCFGMDLLSAFGLIAISFMCQLVASRLICQGGLPYFTLVLAPSDGFLAMFNTRFIAPLSLYLGVVVQKMAFLDLRESLMPSLFHSSKLADGSQPRRRFLWGIILAILVGFVVSFLAMLTLYYKFGLNSLPDDWALETTRRVHENAAQILNHPESVKKWSLVFTIIGGAVMALLAGGYHLFIWWPVHPIGYLVTYSSAMQILWFGFFIGWLNNVLVLRYGGVNLFREVRRLFIGLVVGDMVMAIVWLIVGAFSTISYHVLPL